MKYIVYILIIISSSGSLQKTIAQQDSINKHYSNKIQLIRNIETFAKNKYHIKLKPNFYTQWETPDTFTFYLYVSRPDTIAPPFGYSNYQAFGTDYNQALNKQKYNDSLGYHTLLYKTAGNSACRLSTPFLNYSSEAIAFIAFHELVHRHLQKTKKNIPYEFEEAACDILGTFGVVELFQDTNFKTSLVLDSIITQNLLNREMKKNYITLYHQQLKNYSSDTFPLLSNQKIKSLNQFQQDRFLYSYNNAYILRQNYYMLYYFELEKIYYKYGMKGFIQFLNKLPQSREKAIQKLLQEAQ